MWGLVTAMTGGNWKAGFVIGLVVFISTVRGMRGQADLRQREMRQQAIDDMLMANSEPVRKGWF